MRCESRLGRAWEFPERALSADSQEAPSRFARSQATVRGMALPRLLPAAPQVEIVVPVHNEEAALELSVRRLHRYLSSGFPFSWRIVIADNASTDATAALAESLARDLPSVASLRLERKGRGRALRAAWSASDAQVVCYMDVDLSTDLRALLPLVAPVTATSRSAAAWRTAPAWCAGRGER